MKILYHHRIASKDGQYVHIEEIVHALRRLGHEIVIVEPASINGKDFGEGSSLVKNIRAILPGFIHEIAEFAYSFGDYLKLKRAIRKHKPDAIYERYNLFFISGVWASRKFRLPLILEINAPLFDERSEHDHIGLPGLARWSEEYAWKHADYVLPVTRVLADRVAESGVPESKIRVIHNGVDREKFAQPLDTSLIKKRLGIENKKILGFTGFVREWHRLDRVLEVMHQNQMEDWCFLIVGDGPVRKSLVDQAKHLNLQDKVIFTGLVSRAEINVYVSCFDVALQPDVVAYASPLKLFEYLALGKAVLAPDKPNIREILTHDKDSLLFDVKSGEDFKNKLNRLCGSESLRRDLGLAAKELVDTKGFYWDENGKKIEKLFSQLISDRKN